MPEPGDLLDGSVLFVALPRGWHRLGEAWLLVGGRLVLAQLHCNAGTETALVPMPPLRGRPGLPSHRLSFDPVKQPELTSLWRLVWGDE